MFRRSVVLKRRRGEGKARKVLEAKGRCKREKIKESERSTKNSERGGAVR